MLSRLFKSEIDIALRKAQETFYTLVHIIQTYFCV